MRKFWLTTNAAAWVLLAVLQIWCLSVTLQHPYIGISIEQQPSGWVVTDVDPAGAGYKVGLADGDLLLKVDGRLPSDFGSVRKWQEIEQAKDVVYERGGTLYEADFRGSNPYPFVTLVEEAICFGFAFFLLLRLKRSESARLLAAVFITGGVMYMTMPASIRGDPLGKLAITTLMSVLSLVFLHFLIVFFREKAGVTLRLRNVRIGYAAILSLVPVRGLMFYTPTANAVYQYNAAAALLLFVLGFAAILVMLGRLYYRHGREKSYLASLIKSVWSSLFLSFLPVLSLSFIPILLRGVALVDAVYTSWFILFFPVSFTYLIASNQLYDVVLVFRRLMFAAAFALVPSAVFTVLYALVFAHTATRLQIYFLFIGCTALVTLMLYSAEYWTTRLEKRFFPRKYMLNASLRKISKDLGTISSMRELGDIILADIVNTLEVRGGAIVIQHPEELEIFHTGEMDVGAVQALMKHPPSPRSNPDYTVLEINRHEEFVSYLIMNRKRGNTFLGKEELQWLGLIVTYLGVSLENVHLIRKLKSKLQQLAAPPSNSESAQDLQWFRKLMFELQEEERTRIATDLHDTTMQDLFFLKGRLSAVMQKYTYNEEDKKQLMNLLEFVDLINSGLRQTCFELNPHALTELGFVRTIQKLLENEAYQAPFQLEFLPETGAALVETQELMAKRHLLRIIQELLNNAKKHSRAELVRFRLASDGRLLVLTYEDNGVGYERKEQMEPEAGKSGIGMIQMRGRVLLLKGQMDVQSSLGAGTTVRISIPLQDIRAGGAA